MSTVAISSSNIKKWLIPQDFIEWSVSGNFFFIVTNIILLRLYYDSSTNNQSFHLSLGSSPQGQASWRQHCLVHRIQCWQLGREDQVPCRSPQHCQSSRPSSSRIHHRVGKSVQTAPPMQMLLLVFFPFICSHTCGPYEYYHALLKWYKVQQDLML